MGLIARYDSAWPARFEQEATRLREALGAAALRIEHVGSTSVPELDAKPIIDIQVSVAPARLVPLDPWIELLEPLDYHHLPLPSPPPDEYPFFHRPNRWPTTHHLHLCEFGGPQEKRHLAFRDWLRGHPEDRRAYAALKHELAAPLDETDRFAVFGYTKAKSAFIEALVERASSKP
jgi:GrpB-like predicted nucleotidyltransferase (UPF0157 family)